MIEIVLGSRNRKKLKELVEFLEPLGVKLTSVADYPEVQEVDETGSSFAENAALKASSVARQLGKWAIGEDSGLCVDALGGAPGIHSARYSDPGATDERNNDKLLETLRGVPEEKRTAYYVSHLCLADPQGRICASAEGRCRGRIRESRSGSGGFGYDPLFEIVELHQTFGELDPVVKSVLSHRSRSIAAFVPQVRRLIKSGALTS
jgi:XTP/dITP diphosphohydrolase